MVNKKDLLLAHFEGAGSGFQFHQKSSLVGSIVSRNDGEIVINRNFGPKFRLFRFVERSYVF